MPMRERWAPLLAALVLLAACGGDGDEEAASTTTTTGSSTTTEAPTTTTTEPVDPFTVPDDPADIDEAYVEAVINEHNRVIGDALRIQLGGGDPKEIIDRYNAIYVPEAADFELTELFNMTEEEIARLRMPPGNGATEVTALLDVTEECIVAEVVQSADDLLIEPPPHFEAELVLTRVRDGASSLNETAWQTSSLTGRTAEGSSCDV